MSAQPEPGLSALGRRASTWTLLLVLLSAALWPALPAQADKVEIGDPDAQAGSAIGPAELEQLLAPVALYPDVLLAKVLAASTYPLDVVEAARWARARPGLEGGAAIEAASGMSWAPSVRALIAVPELLVQMSDNLRWTRRLGDAFLNSERRVMAALQDLRASADAAGNLDAMRHARVHRQRRVIIIEAAQPDRVYIPYYNPAVIYGQWRRPSYPPIHWRPPAGVRSGAEFHWEGGIRSGNAQIFLGTLDWQRSRLVVLNGGLHPTTQLMLGRYPLSYFYSQGHYRDPDRHGFQRWRHRPDRHHEEYGRGRLRPSAATAASGKHSPTGSYLRPPGISEVAGEPRSDGKPGVGQAVRRDERGIEQRRPNASSKIQFRRGDPHRIADQPGQRGAERMHSAPDHGVQRIPTRRYSGPPQGQRPGR